MTCEWRREYQRRSVSIASSAALIWRVPRPRHGPLRGCSHIKAAGAERPIVAGIMLPLMLP